MLREFLKYKFDKKLSRLKMAAFFDGWFVLENFATFLKKGSAKNFQSGNVLNNILRSTDEQ